MLSGLLNNFSTTQHYSLEELMAMHKEVYAKLFIVHTQMTEKNTHSDQSMRILQRLNLYRNKAFLPQRADEVVDWYKKQVAHLLNTYRYVLALPDGIKLLKITDVIYDNINKMIRYNATHYFPKDPTVYVTKYKAEIGDKVIVARSLGLKEDYARTSEVTDKQRKRLAYKKKKEYQKKNRPFAKYRHKKVDK